MNSSHRRHSGFTLIELLVVMTIIAMLAAAIFAAGQAAMNAARKAQATQIAVALAGGIQSFRTEYSRWPYPGGKKSEIHQSDSTFMVNLIGQDTTLNKRGMSFVDGIPQAKGATPAGGIYRQGDSGMVFDPWANLFDIYIDENGDGEITDPEGGSQPLYQKVAVISRGADGVLQGTNNDGKDALRDNARSY